MFILFFHDKLREFFEELSLFDQTDEETQLWEGMKFWKELKNPLFLTKIKFFFKKKKCTVALLQSSSRFDTSHSIFLLDFIIQEFTLTPGKNLLIYKYKKISRFSGKLRKTCILQN